MQTGNSTGISLATGMERPRVLTQHGGQHGKPRPDDQYPNQNNQNGTARTTGQTSNGQGVGPQGGARSTKVFVFGCDRLSQAGMIAYLRDCPGIELVPEAGMATADVTVVAAEAM